MKLLGIDNGISGGLALLDTETEEWKVCDITLDAHRNLDCSWLFHLLCEWEPQQGVIEQCFNNNDLVELGGKFIAVAELVGCHVEKVSVSRWKKVSVGSSANDKPLSVKTCQQLYPSADIMRPTPKGRKSNPDHNRAEAVLLTHYLRTTLKV